MATEESKPTEELSMKDAFRLKAQTLPPLKKHVPNIGFVHTTSMVEVFQFRIDKFDDFERRGELYGKIEAVDTDGSTVLYHRDRDNSENIHANSTITLTGPARSILLLVGFAVNIELLLRDDRVGSDHSKDDFVLCKWQFSWDAVKHEIAHITRGKFLRDFCDRPDVLSSSEFDCKHQPVGYDQPLAATFEGPNGCCLTMYYALLEHAVQAWVKVDVVGVNVVPTVAEYNARGSIIAKYGHFENKNDSSIVEYCKVELLKTGDLQSVQVEHLKEIQLSRCVVVVPAYTSLLIEADLWDTDSNLKIGGGKVEFIPSHEGFAADYIMGDNGFVLRVMVYWNFLSTVVDNSPFPS